MSSEDKLWAGFWLLCAITICTLAGCVTYYNIQQLKIIEKMSPAQICASKMYTGYEADICNNLKGFLDDKNKSGTPPSSP